MSERLKALIKTQIVKEGKSGRAKFCLKADIHTSSLDNYLGNRSEIYRPRPQTVYKLALACGCSEAEALELVDECSAEGKKSA